MKERVIIDCDPGIDDSLAILLAGFAKKIQIEALTIVSGNIEVNQGALNAIKALEMAKSSFVPVYKGAALPLVREYVDASDTHGADGIGENYFLVHDCSEKKSAQDFMIEELRKHPYELTILALGPLTTLANIIQIDATVLALAKRIVVMGGCARVNGNCSPVAEYNFWVDPDAAKIFFQADLPNITLIPLDVTFATVFTPAMREMIHQFDTELADYVNSITRLYVDFHWKQERTLGCVINDPLVVAYIIDENVCRYEEAYVDIETQGIGMGQSICDFELRSDRNNPVRICTTVQTDLFFQIFLKTIFKGQEDEIELMIKKGYIL